MLQKLEAGTEEAKEKMYAGYVREGERERKD